MCALFVRIIGMVSGIVVVLLLLLILVIVLLLWLLILVLLLLLMLMLPLSVLVLVLWFIVYCLLDGVDLLRAYYVWVVDWCLFGEY